MSSGAGPCRPTVRMPPRKPTAKSASSEARESFSDASKSRASGTGSTIQVTLAPAPPTRARPRRDGRGPRGWVFGRTRTPPSAARRARRIPRDRPRTCGAEAWRASAPSPPLAQRSWVSHAQIQGVKPPKLSIASLHRAEGVFLFLPGPGRARLRLAEHGHRASPQIALDAIRLQAPRDDAAEVHHDPVAPAPHTLGRVFGHAAWVRREKMLSTRMPPRPTPVVTRPDSRLGLETAATTRAPRAAIAQ